MNVTGWGHIVWEMAFGWLWDQDSRPSSMSIRSNSPVSRLTRIRLSGRRTDRVNRVTFPVSSPLWNCSSTVQTRTLALGSGDMAVLADI